MGTGCTSTFMVSKECSTYYLGSTTDGVYRMLCETGDFERVLADAGLPSDIAQRLYEAQCRERSREVFLSAYQRLSPAQQDSLKSAFRENGYEINAKPADNLRLPDPDRRLFFCPSS